MYSTARSSPCANCTTTPTTDRASGGIKRAFTEQYTTSARVLVQAYHEAWPDLSFVGKMMARVTVVRVLTARLLVRCTLSTMPSK